MFVIFKSRDHKVGLGTNCFLLRLYDLEVFGRGGVCMGHSELIQKIKMQDNMSEEWRAGVSVSNVNLKEGIQEWRVCQLH